MHVDVYHLPLYRHEGLWCFDHPEAGILQEPFVEGADAIIDALVIEDAHGAARPLLSFSAGFGLVGFTEMRWITQVPREDGTWNRYACPRLGLDGLLCPRLFAFFDEAPARLHVRLQAMNHLPVGVIKERVLVAGSSAPDSGAAPARTRARRPAALS